MGVEQSKLPVEQHREKALARRPHHDHDLLNSDDDYVHIDEKQIGGGPQLARDAEDLPISQMADWQSSILADPKNRYVPAADLSSPSPTQRHREPMPNNHD